MMPDHPAAVQLYTVRTLLANDFEGTLAKIAEIGFEEIEAHDLFRRTASEVRTIIDDTGLTLPARHVPLAELRTRIDAAIEDSITLGCRWIVCPFVHQQERTLDGYRRVAEDLNVAAASVRAAGLGFAYHNHDFEFEPVDDVIAYDLLLERCDPALVAMELDLYWIAKAGADPLHYFVRYPGRFPLIHVKDMAPDRSMTEVGSGIIDFATIFAESEQAGIRHYIVEHDNPTDPLASITTSFEGIGRLI